jgi:hypothetical protein
VCDSPQWRHITQITGGWCQQVSGEADLDAAFDRVGADLWGGKHD